MRKFAHLHPSSAYEALYLKWTSNKKNCILGIVLFSSFFSVHIFVFIGSSIIWTVQCCECVWSWKICHNTHTKRKRNETFFIHFCYFQQINMTHTHKRSRNSFCVRNMFFSALPRCIIVHIMFALQLELVAIFFFCFHRRCLPPSSCLPFFFFFPFFFNSML